jgi:putative flippase GtrA
MFHLKKKEEREVKRITEYIISGGAFFWSGYLVFFLCDRCDRILGFHLFWSTAVSYAVGWTINYLLQRYWVFDNPKLAKHQTETTTRYLVISFVNLLINYVILESLKRVGITPYIGQFVSSGFFTVWNYLWYKYWVFPEKYPRKKRNKK